MNDDAIDLMQAIFDADEAGYVYPFGYDEKRYNALRALETHGLIYDDWIYDSDGIRRHHLWAVRYIHTIMNPYNGKKAVRP